MSFNQDIQILPYRQLDNPCQEIVPLATSGSFPLPSMPSEEIRCYYPGVYNGIWNSTLNSFIWPRFQGMGGFTVTRCTTSDLGKTWTVA